ncbi:MSMEG_1061 family FMN-dependent PPOX-type flavoprotein [Rhodococcus sp. JS3073]|uniref:MSMEG_1061 family FMN-dependent PPOX-type flavoprotein n=1 Tax=Rhodococcus sp. JS3073 TaxID=3002901 RepID=UPI00228625EA|nr:MSMEG_1061 family FMN-dependent PPOX-type flavoprotein [Rhodococcus sp. JS3073]WAM12087.1 pyridoxamine 5'-phosphate oxidase family protein [Rhodococcus sp. JS3073]
MSDGGYRRLTVEDIRAALGEPDAPVRQKIVRTLDVSAQRFIAHSPFVCLGTASKDGADASPRGDNPGFVRVLDSTTVALPDRTGNNLCDSFRNVIENPSVGMLFIVPGMRETLRVNGNGFVTDDRDLLRRFEVDGRIPKLALVVSVTEVYFHCGKSLIRSRLWDPDAQLIAPHVTLGSNVFSMHNVERDKVSGTASQLGEVLERSYVTEL